MRYYSLLILFAQLQSAYIMCLPVFNYTMLHNYNLVL